LHLATRQPALTALSETGVVAACGPDAASFLNSQLTVDVTTVDAQRWQLGAYCSPKGRVVALFEMWRADDGFRLLLPAEQVEPLRSRLARYVLRSKVQLVDVTGQWVVFGLTGPGIEEALRLAGLECPDQPWTSQPQDDGARLVRVPASPRTGARLMLIVPALTSEAWRKKLAAVAQVDAGVWWWSKIDAGLPDVFAVTQERFVPQMLNLDVLGAVHFRKGCYPGQEIVARSQYLGKLRRRMMRGHADGASAGDDIFDENQGADRGPAGTVVMAAGSPEGGVDLLFECPTELAGTAQLRVGQAQSAPMSLGELPYPMINPTA
jgi:hypothetical protein